MPWDSGRIKNGLDVVEILCKRNRAKTGKESSTKQETRRWNHLSIFSRFGPGGGSLFGHPPNGT